MCQGPLNLPSTRQSDLHFTPVHFSTKLLKAKVSEKQRGEAVLGSKSENTSDSLAHIAFH